MHPIYCIHDRPVSWNFWGGTFLPCFAPPNAQNPTLFLNDTEGISTPTVAFLYRPYSGIAERGSTSLVVEKKLHRLNVRITCTMHVVCVALFKISEIVGGKLK